MSMTTFNWLAGISIAIVASICGYVVWPTASPVEAVQPAAHEAPRLPPVNVSFDEWVQLTDSQRQAYCLSKFKHVPSRAPAVASAVLHDAQFYKRRGYSVLDVVFSLYYMSEEKIDNAHGVVSRDVVAADLDESARYNEIAGHELDLLDLADVDETHVYRPDYTTDVSPRVTLAVC